MRKRGHHLLITTPPTPTPNQRIPNGSRHRMGVLSAERVPILISSLRNLQSLSQYSRCLSPPPFLAWLYYFCTKFQHPKNEYEYRTAFFANLPTSTTPLTVSTFNPSLSSVIVVFAVLHKNLVVVFHLACWLLCILLCWPASHHSKYYYEDFMLNLGKRRLHPPFSFN